MLKYAIISIILRIGGKVAIPGHGRGAMLRPRLVVQVQPLLREAVKGRASIPAVVVVVASSVGAGSDFRSGRGLGFYCLRGRGRLRFLRGRGRLRFLRGWGRLRFLRGWGSLRLLGLRGRAGLRLALLALPTLTVCITLLGDQGYRAFGYLAHILAVGIGALEETFHVCTPIERVGSGLDSNGAGDGDDCSEGFELHFRVGGNITASDEDERNEGNEEMSV